MASSNESYVQSYDRFVRKRRSEDAPTAFDGGWEGTDVLKCRLRSSGSSEQPRRFGNLSDVEVLVEFANFRKPQATWQDLRDVAAIPGLAAKCKRHVQFALLLPFMPDFIWCREALKFYPKVAKNQDFQAAFVEQRRRLEESATRAIGNMFQAALRYDPRSVKDPTPDIRMCEQEQEVLFDRLHPGRRARTSWRDYCPKRPPIKHMVCLCCSS